MAGKHIVLFIVGVVLLGAMVFAAVSVYYRTDVLVEGIMYDRDNPIAIVNGNIFNLGSQVKDLEIVDITQDQVKFRDKSGRIIVKRPAKKKSASTRKVAKKTTDDTSQNNYDYHYDEAVELYKEAKALTGGRFSSQKPEAGEGFSFGEGGDAGMDFSAFQDITQGLPQSAGGPGADPEASLEAYETALKKLQEALANMDSAGISQEALQNPGMLPEGASIGEGGIDPQTALEAYQKAMQQMQTALGGLDSATAGGMGLGSFSGASYDPNQALRAYQKALYKAQTALGRIMDEGKVKELKKMVEECRYAIGELEKELKSGRANDYMELAREYYSSGTSYLGQDENRDAKEAFRQALDYCNKALAQASGNEIETVRIESLKKRVETQLKKLKGFNL